MLDRRQKLHKIAETVNISIDLVDNILSKHLNMNEPSGIWVLSIDQTLKSADAEKP